MTSKKYFDLEHTYMQLPEIFFSRQSPSKVPKSQLIILNEGLADELGMDIPFLKSEEGAKVLSGNIALEDSIAQAYAGHQFGYFTMLGDGRAILLGEGIAKNGERYDFQLKGAGRTPYSRGGDGKAALGPMLREYIISEGMHALGIPTTRSLAVVTTGEAVYREQPLEGAVLARIAKSHIRIGTFQYAARWGAMSDLKALADYTLNRHFSGYESVENPYLYLLSEVVKRQAQLISKWQLVGFIHGVMNTDNMAICGESIDYGPCAFMDTYDPKTVFSSIDREGRYAYGNQPIMAGWNLARFAETLLPLIHTEHDEAVRLAQEVVSQFSILYKTYWERGMCAKLGLSTVRPENVKLVEGLLALMYQYKADYTNTFRLLTIGEEEALDFYHTEEYKQWKTEWKNQLTYQDKAETEVKALMMQSNPTVIPRNHRVEEALKAAVEHHDYSVMEKLLSVISKTYDYDANYKAYAEVPKLASYGYKTFCGT